MITPAVLALSALLCGITPITEEDAKSAATILKKSDDEVNNFKDQEYVTRMTLLAADGKVEKVIEMKIQQKGGDKRLVRFVKPGDVKGLSVLVEGGNTYVYLPQFNKTRRVAAHTSKQSFMGTDFNMGPPPYPLEYILRDATGPEGRYIGNFGKETSVIVDYPFITGRSTPDSYLTGHKLVEVLESGLKRFGW